ncbi:MAG: AAA family ATPase, partial [Chloroflexi bacterium]|nr:AAA family ATPase [Chloroflexota bacterium]
MADRTPADGSQFQLVPLIPRPDRGRLGAPPIPLTSFVGREREIAALTFLPRHSGARLATLTGPGGVGKTRLALRVIEELRADFADEVAFVSLAPLTDPNLVAATVAHV